MIELGLARISKLLGESILPWRAVHVAGTNGKGSVCAYTSAMLHAHGITCGRFTSPHLIDRWDCITINEETVSERVFRQVEAHFQVKNDREQIRASEFELLTATAFEIFAREKVEVGVVEVGMGGRLDATNVLKDPLVTVITKIGKDHEAFLGNTLEAIAYQKAGIIKPGVPCVVDGTNPEEVLEVFKSSGREVQSGPITQIPQDSQEIDGNISKLLMAYEKHQRANIAIALETSKIVLSLLRVPQDETMLFWAITRTIWPGRLQMMSIQSLTGRKESILVDGAHNGQSAKILGEYVGGRLRNSQSHVTWVMGASQGKDIREMLGHLLKAGDTLLTVKFGTVDGMPWVQATPPDAFLREAQSLHQLASPSAPCNSVLEALKIATAVSRGGPLVVAGSLYLVSDLFRLIRDKQFFQ
jgi:folylpolyglutamate synthase/dihydrofolate synthase